MIEYTARITSQDTPRVGGRNLILGTTSEQNSLSWTDWYSSTNIKSVRGLTAGTYTLSFQLHSYEVQDREEGKLGVHMYVQLMSKEIRRIKLLVEPFASHSVLEGKYVCTFTIDDTDFDVLWFRFRDMSPKGRKTISYSSIKLERGTISTDWTPAPEDVAESVSKVNTSLTSLASTLLDPNEGDIPQLFRQQDQLANSVKDKADKLELANSVSSLQGEIDKRALGLHLDNAFAYIENIVKEIDSSRSYTISDSGYISSSVHNSCRYVSKEVTPSSTVCRTPNTQPQIRLTLRSDHDALKRQVNSLTAQLAQLQATTKITPVLNTDTRKRSGSTTLYPQYGDWLLTSDSQEQYISFSGLSAEIGRSIYIQTRRKAYLYANNQSFYGLPGTSSSVAVNQWLANNTTYRFLRADATTWLVTASSSPYPWT